MLPSAFSFESSFPLLGLETGRNPALLTIPFMLEVLDIISVLLVVITLGLFQPGKVDSISEEVETLFMQS